MCERIPPPPGPGSGVVPLLPADKGPLAGACRVFVLGVVGNKLYLYSTPGRGPFSPSVPGLAPTPQVHAHRMGFGLEKVTHP